MFDKCVIIQMINNGFCFNIHRLKNKLKKGKKERKKERRKTEEKTKKETPTLSQAALTPRNRG